MKLDIPTKLETFFKGQHGATILYDDDLISLLANKIIQILNNKTPKHQKATNTEINYIPLAEDINDWFEKKFPEEYKKRKENYIKQKKDNKEFFVIVPSYLRNLCYENATKKRARLSREKVLIIYHSLYDYEPIGFESIQPEVNVGNTTLSSTNSKLITQLRAGSISLFNSQLSSGKYKGLKISESILPCLKYETEDGRSSMLSWKPDAFPLLSIVRDSDKNVAVNNLFLVAEGGAGKTTSLLHLWNCLGTNNHDILPIFIPLMDLNFELKSDFIFNYIQRNYLRSMDLTVEEKNELWTILSSDFNSAGPRILLLLDGLNEIPLHKGLLLNEIYAYMNAGSMCQMIISSRVDDRETHLALAHFKLLKVMGLTDQQIDGHLKGIDNPRGLSIIDKSLISNPLMLSLYSLTNESLLASGNNNILLRTTVQTSSDLFWNFLQIQLLRYPSKDEVFHRTKFFLNHLLPALAYLAYTEENEIIKKPDLLRYISTCSQKFSTDEFQNVWLDYFDYFSFIGLEDPAPVQYRNIKAVLCDSLALLRERKGLFYFFHQNFMDFLVGLHIVNTLQEFAESKKANPSLPYPTEFFNHVWPKYMRRYVGECCNIKTSTDTLFNEQMLNYSRGIFNDPVVEMVNLNLINTLMDCKADLSKINFQSLDLSKVQFNGHWLFKVGDKITSAVFDGSLINTDLFFPPAHACPVRAICFSPDSKFLATACEDEVIKIWDLAADRSIKKIFVDTVAKRMIYHPKGTHIIILNNDGNITSWDIEKTECVYSANTDLTILNNITILEYSQSGSKLRVGNMTHDVFEEFDMDSGDKVRQDSYSNEAIRLEKIVNEIASEISEENLEKLTSELSFNNPFISASGDLLIAPFDTNTLKEEENIAFVLNTKTNEKIFNIKHEGQVHSSTISLDGKKIAVSYEGGIKVWNLNKLYMSNYFPNRSMELTYISYSPCGKKIVTTSDNYIQEWDLELGYMKSEFLAHKNKVGKASYSHDGNYIVSYDIKNRIRKWDSKSLKCIHEFSLIDAPNREVRAVYIDASGHLIYEFVDEDTKVKLYNHDLKIMLPPPKIYPQYPKVIFADDYNIISINGVPLKDFVFKDLRFARFFVDQNDSCFAMCRSQDGKKVAAIVEDVLFFEWSVETGQALNLCAYMPGLNIYGCSFKNLHKDSLISEANKKWMEMRGGNFN